MELQQDEIREFELTADELDRASGGIKNCETEAWKDVCWGIVIGQVMAGAKINCA